MKDFLKNFFVYGFGSSIGKFISFFLLPIYARIFSPEDYGTMDFISSLIAIISIFGMFQIETGFQRYFYEKEKQEGNCLFSTTMWFTLLCSFVVVLIFLIFIPFISRKYFNNNYQLELILCGINIIPANLLSVLFVLFRYKKQIKKFFFISLFQVIGSAVLTIVLVLIFKLGIKGVFLSVLIINVATLIISIIDLSKSIVFSINRLMLKDMLAFALPQFPARFGSISNVYINRFFMAFYLSMTAIGLYSVGLKIASGMQLVLSAFQLAWNPFLYETINKPNHKKTFVDIYKTALIVLSLITLIMCLVGKELLLFLTTPEYLESYIIIPGLTYYYSLYLLKEMVDIGVKVTKKTQYTSYIYICSAAINIIFLFVLVPSLGLKGVVFSLLASNVFLYISTYYISLKLYPMAFPNQMTLLNLLFNISIIIIFMYLDISFRIRLITLCFIIMALIVFIYKKRQFINIKYS